ncbi:hypothetical protein [Fortiea contorta]|uniref:hypothetical protein n=1 Tax=Fortiea contorta TaxID=1892405 RepID=UPI00034A954C|nr:hypothetical protein [Fortiea contorta]
MNLTKKLSIATAGVAVGLAGVAIPSSAQAAQLFNFDYSSSSFGSFSLSASGTLTTTDLDTATNRYTITGITGTRTFNGTTEDILGLIAPGGFQGNNNILSANYPFLDDNGFAFNVGSGEVNVNGATFMGLFSQYLDNTDGMGYVLDTFNVTKVTNAQPVPEPTTVAAAIASGAGLIAARLKRRQKQKLSQAA